MSETPDTDDRLEAELAALRPAELPPDLVARIGAAVEMPRRRGLWLIPLAGVAAGLLLAAMWHLFVRQMPPVPTPVVATSQVSPAEAADGPALFTYRRAIAGPPSELDDMLDRHAARTLPAGPRVTASTELSTLR